MSNDTAPNHDTANAEKSPINHSSREISSSNGSSTAKIPARNVAFQPPSRYQTRHSLDLDDYFAGPRDMQKHSKLPLFMRIHGSVMPKMILPLTFVGAWATAITCLDRNVHSLGKCLGFDCQALRLTSLSRRRYCPAYCVGFRRCIWSFLPSLYSL